MNLKGNKFLLAIILIVAMSILLASCSAPADVASQNLSTQADQFQINRRIVFYNGITDKYIFVVEGFCSFGNSDPARELTVTCKTGPSEYKKHFLGLSDNMSYFGEQLDSANVSTYHYKTYFRPDVMLPSIEIQTQNHP
jgi:hypothetical protein